MTRTVFVSKWSPINTEIQLHISKLFFSLKKVNKNGATSFLCWNQSPRWIHPPTYEYLLAKTKTKNPLFSFDWLQNSVHAWSFNIAARGTLPKLPRSGLRSRRGSLPLSWFSWWPRGRAAASDREYEWPRFHFRPTRLRSWPPLLRWAPRFWTSVNDWQVFPVDPCSRRRQYWKKRKKERKNHESVSIKFCQTEGSHKLKTVEILFFWTSAIQ